MDVERVLVVCTGNICRSPIAMALLRAELRRRPLVDPVLVTSAGLVTENRPAEPHAVATMAQRGLRLDEHRSRMVTERMVSLADLIIGMERLHVREVTLLDESAFERSFTLRELVRRGVEVGPREPGSPLADWLIRANADRSRVRLLGDASGDDVADPMGGDRDDFERCADEVDDLLGALADLLWPVF